MVSVDGLARGDGIHVIALDGEPMVKRLDWDRPSSRITIHSENSRYPEPKHVPMEGDLLRIEGKVVGWFHKHTRTDRRTCTIPGYCQSLRAIPSLRHGYAATAEPQSIVLFA